MKLSQKNSALHDAEEKWVIWGNFHCPGGFFYIEKKNSVNKDIP